MNLKQRNYFLLAVAIGILVVWLLYTPPGLLGKADAVGYAVCHRIETHSFLLGNRPIALCARCTGQYLSAVLAILYAGFLGRRQSGWPRKGGIVLLAFFVLAYGVDGVNSTLHAIGKFHLYEPQNALRLVTGVGMGLVMGLGTWTLFQSMVWRVGDGGPNLDAPVLGGFWPWAGLLVGAGIVAALVLDGNPLILYPLTLVSALGVVGLLTMLYALIWIMVFRAENTFRRVRSLASPLLAGFGTAMLQILALDLVRHWATGTWGGFPLG